MTYPSILHIEDEDASAFLLQSAVQLASIANPVFRFATGESALAFLFQSGVYAQAKPPGLIILDISLPRMDGFAVLSVIKSRSELSAIPVVILSSSARDEDRERSLQLGAHQYLVKPANASATSRALIACCRDFLTFQEANGASSHEFVLRTPSIVFERTENGGVQTNVAVVLPEGSRVQLAHGSAAGPIVKVLFGTKSFWMFIDDLYERATPS